MKIEDFILLIESSYTNARIYHWNSDSYSVHKATENYYEAIRDLIDKLVEVAQGRFGMKYSFEGEIIISNLSVITYFSQLSHQVTLMVEKLFKEYKDLENIALEILEEVNKMRYLLTLS